MTSYSVAPLMLACVTMLAGPAASAATENPLCATADERRKVELALADALLQSPGQIARGSGMTEAAVLHALPPDIRVPVAMAEFAELWQKLGEWPNAQVIVYAPEGTFELFGPLPPARLDRGQLNIHDADGRYGGHLNVDRLAAIYLLSTEDADGEIHQVAFFDRDGRQVFSVRVPLNDDGTLQTQPHYQFLRVKDAYGGIARKKLLTDFSCMWAVVTYDIKGQSAPDVKQIDVDRRR